MPTSRDRMPRLQYYPLFNINCPKMLQKPSMHCTYIFCKKKKRTLIGKKIAYIPNLSQKTSKFNFISESWRSEWETVRFCAKSRILSGTLGELAYNGNAQVEVFIHRFATKFWTSIIDFGNERVDKDIRHHKHENWIYLRFPWITPYL